MISSINTINSVRQKGADVIIVAPYPSLQYLKTQNLTKQSFAQKWKEKLGVKELLCVKSVRFPLYPGLRLTKSWDESVYAVLKDFQPDVIHFHTQLSLGRMAIAMAKRLQCALVASFHTFFAEPEYIRNSKLASVLHLHKSKKLQKWLWDYNNYLFYKQCHRVVVLSDFSKQILIEKGLDPEMLTIVYNGLPLDHYEQYRQLTKNAENPYGQYFVYVGRISVEKSLNILIDAAEKVFAAVSDMKLLIVGDGPSFEELRAYITKKKLQERIVCIGSMSHEELLQAPILRNALLFTTASKSEAQPVSILEAMFFGLPVVGVDKRGVPALLDFDNGLVVEADNAQAFANAILRIVKDESYRQRLSQNARIAVQRFDIDKTTDAMLKVYHEAIFEAQRKLRKF